MNAWLQTDANTPGYMLQSLQWNDIASIHAICKLWRAYLSNPQVSTPNHRCTLIIRRSQLPLAAASTWLTRLLHDMQCHVADDPESLKQASLFLSFPRLTSLQLRWPTRFLATYLFEVIGKLQALRSLIISLDSCDVYMAASIPSCRLTALQNCPHLATLHLTGNKFVPSLWQIQDLITCKSLTDLNFGTWSSYGGSLDSTSDDYSKARWEFLSQSKLQKLEGVEWFNLWKIPTITSLTLRITNSDLYSRNLDWRLLTRFTVLKELEFSKEIQHSSAAKSPPKDFWASLIRCTSITTVKFGFLNLQNSELTQLFQSLPYLSSLSFADVVFESCSAFVHGSKSLKKLRFENCHTVPKKPIFYHLCLPTIPGLEELQIRDDWMNYITTEKHDRERALDQYDDDRDYEEDEDSYDCNSDPVYAVKEAFSFMLKGRMPNIKTHSIFY